MYSVRGKRRKDKNADEQVKVHHGTRGRPMKQMREPPQSRRIVNANLKNIERDTDVEEFEVAINQSQLSKLEQLPNELIQLIFFYCLETNLPKASIHLARALSTELTYRTLILFAYFDDDGQLPVETKVFLPATYRYLDVVDKMHLQRNISSCRWYQLERLLKCLPDLSWLAMLQAWHREHLMENVCLGIMEEDEALTNPLPFLRSSSPKRRMQLPRLVDVGAVKKYYSAKGDDKSHLSQSPIHTGTLSGITRPQIRAWWVGYERASPGLSHHQRLVRSQDPYASVLAARVLPDWLLVGSPWTDQKLALLQLLRQGLLHIQRDKEFELSASAVFQGMADAIETKNFLALKTLLEIHDFAINNRGSQILPLSVRQTPLQHQLPVQLFHLASRAGAESSKIMTLLVRGDLYSLPRDDHVLTGWALRQVREGRKVAEIMLGHMEGLTGYQSQGRPPFLCGAGRVNDLSEVSTFRAELNYCELHHVDYFPLQGAGDWYN